VADVNGGERGTGNGERFFGAILAGGGSRRFGAPKALAQVGGRAIVERVRDALMEAGAEVGVIAGERVTR